MICRSLSVFLRRPVACSFHSRVRAFRRVSFPRCALCCLSYRFAAETIASMFAVDRPSRTVYLGFANGYYGYGVVAFTTQ